MTDPAPVPVLLVDDRPANLLALEAVLGDLGVELARATSGEEALGRLLDAEFAAVLLDVQMPGMDGFEVARLVRARHRSKATPVIFVTAEEAAGFPVREAYRLGAVDFLVKPLLPEAVRAKVGALADLWRERRRATAELERRVAERTAELAAARDALAAEVARRVELARRLGTAQEAERQRLSRELHDSVGQLLTGLSLAAKAAHTAGGPLHPAAARLDEVLRLADAVGKELHGVAVRLRPTALDDLGLAAALEQLVREWARRAGVAADYQATGLDARRLPAEVETALYRVVQEALTNVARHARAAAVAVTVGVTDGAARAVVEDDGEGFDPRGAGAGRLGVVGMRERLLLVGGTLDVESRPGLGTTVIARVPLPSEAPGVERREP